MVVVVGIWRGEVPQRGRDRKIEGKRKINREKRKRRSVEWWWWGKGGGGTLTLAQPMEFLWGELSRITGSMHYLDI